MPGASITITVEPDPALPGRLRFRCTTETGETWAAGRARRGSACGNEAVGNSQHIRDLIERSAAS